MLRAHVAIRASLALPYVRISTTALLSQWILIHLLAQHWPQILRATTTLIISKWAIL